MEGLLLATTSAEQARPPQRLRVTTTYGLLPPALITPSTYQCCASLPPSLRAGLKYWKPTSPGQRFRITIDRSDIWKGGPLPKLVKGVKRWGGRNRHGRITVRHRGGGHKRKLRMVDWVRRPPVASEATEGTPLPLPLPPLVVVCCRRRCLQLVLLHTGCWWGRQLDGVGTAVGGRQRGGSKWHCC